MSSRSLIGQTVGKYQVVENLGRGGMAEVYKAYQETLDRYVAIKVMHSFLADEKGFLGRFQREARAMAALNHPNIVGVYDFDIFEEMYYIAMEYVSGGTLKDLIESMSDQEESLPLSVSTRVVLEVADALAYAHGRGMVHRDIKPGNIMLTEDGRAVLTDFGIAKILSGPTFTATGAMVGTPAYMSPEQGLGKPGDERSDLYALGVLFYQMATGRLPYDADTPLAVILKHVNEPVPTPTDLNNDIPAAIQSVIVKAMAKDPEERYQSANEMIQKLQEAAKDSDLDLAHRRRAANAAAAAQTGNPGRCDAFGPGGCGNDDVLAGASCG
jgi:serine/threonine protein kinase